MSFLFVASVQDSLHALNRVVSLLRGRHFQVRSIATARSETPQVARVSIVVDASQPKPQRLAAHLEKLEEAWSVTQIEEKDAVCRAVALVKLDESVVGPGIVAGMVKAGQAHLLDRTTGAVILELFGTPQDVEGVIATFPPHAVIELAQPGEIVMTRGAKPTSTTK
jgi:acetolactate synthase-1/3 small subunit